MATLLPLHSHELYVVLDALVAFADASEGDGLRTSEHCDEVAARVRGLRQLAHEDSEQLMRSIGLGRYSDRPQG